MLYDIKAMVWSQKVEPEMDMMRSYIVNISQGGAAYSKASLNAFRLLQCRLS
jgi:hypothetical protein